MQIPSFNGKPLVSMSTWNYVWLGNEHIWMAHILQITATQYQSTLFCEHVFQGIKKTESCFFYLHPYAPSFLWTFAHVSVLGTDTHICTQLHTLFTTPWVSSLKLINMWDTLPWTFSIMPSSGHSGQKKTSRFQIMDASVRTIWPHN